MPTIRAVLSKEHLKKAEEAAASRKYTSRDPLIFADDREPGLSIRVQASTATWILKFRGKTRSLGTLNEVRSPTAARQLAVETRDLMRVGVGDEAARFVRQRRAGKTSDEAAAAVARQDAYASGKWKWEDLAQRYPDDYLSKPRTTTRGVRPPSLKSAEEARRYLRDLVVIKHLGGRLLMELQRSDFEAVRDELYDVHGRKTASRQFVAYSSAAMSWARGYHAGRSGLEKVDRWWIDTKKREETIPAPKTRFPELADLARVLRIADSVRVAPGRLIQRETSDVVVCSLWWLALTAQRATAALRVTKESILPWEGAPEAGWRIATFPVEDMKGKRFHAIPLPPRAAMLLERVALSADANSSFVFPAQRQARDRDAPLSRSTPRLLIDRLRGRAADISFVEKKNEKDDEGRREEDTKEDKDKKVRGPLKDLLAGIPHFSVHDLRRTFATICGENAVRGDAISAVLDHADGSVDAPKVSAAPTRAEITRLVYDHSQRLALKAIAMKEWCDLLFKACDEEWKKNGGRIERPLPRHPGEPYPTKPEFKAWQPWYRTIEQWHAGKPKPTSSGTLGLAARRRAVEDADEDT